jgi:hypothetical protein
MHVWPLHSYRHVCDYIPVLLISLQMFVKLTKNAQNNGKFGNTKTPLASPLESNQVPVVDYIETTPESH